MPSKAKKVRFDIDHCALCFKDKSYFEDWSRFPTLGCHYSCMLFASNLVQRYAVSENGGDEDDDDVESFVTAVEEISTSKDQEKDDSPAGRMTSSPKTSSDPTVSEVKDCAMVDRGFHCSDVRREVSRASRLKCSHCKKHGASIGCNVSKCRYQYHLPCALAAKAICIYDKQFPVFCFKHAPKQNLSLYKLHDPNPICCVCHDTFEDFEMKTLALMSPRVAANSNVTTLHRQSITPAEAAEVCHSEVFHSIVHGECCPPAWIHRECIMKWSSSAGLHHLRCPLCFNTTIFIDALKRMGIWILDRDAAWETPSGFQDLHDKVLATCHASECLCPLGVDHDDSVEWDLQKCLVCATYVHVNCGQVNLQKSMQEKWPEERDLFSNEKNLVDYVRNNMHFPTPSSNTPNRYYGCDVKNVLLCFACTNVALREIESWRSRSSSPSI